MVPRLQHDYRNLPCLKIGVVIGLVSDGRYLPRDRIRIFATKRELAAILLGEVLRRENHN